MRAQELESVLENAPLDPMQVVDLTEEDVSFLDIVFSGCKRSVESDGEEVVFIANKKAKPLDKLQSSFLHFFNAKDYLNLAEICKEFRGTKMSLQINAKTSCPPLHYAVIKNDLTAMKLIIEHANPEFSCTDSKGHTALTLAIQLDRKEAFSFLAKRLKTAQLNALVAFDGLNALHVAAMTPGSSKYISALLGLGVDPLTRCNRNGWTPYVYAALGDFEGNFCHLVELFDPERFADKANEPLLHVLLNAEKFDAADTAIVMGFPCSFVNSLKQNVLHLAANLDAPKIIDTLINTLDAETIKSLADSSESIFRSRPIEYATILGYLDVFKLLWPISESRESVISLAAEHGQLGIMKYLVEEVKVDLNDVEECPLTIAYASGHKAIVQYLIMNGPKDPDSDGDAKFWYLTEEDGLNVLQLAVIEEDLHMVQFLLDAGMDPCVFDYSCTCSALAWAIFRGSKEMVVALKKAGASVHEAINPELMSEDLMATDLFELARECAPEILSFLQSGLLKDISSE